MTATTFKGNPAVGTPLARELRKQLERDTRTEKEVERDGDKAMKDLGWIAVRFSQARASMQTRGIPDRRYYHPALGLALWWEAKKVGGSQSIYQRQFQAMVEACGECYVLGPSAVLVDVAVKLMATASGRPPAECDPRQGRLPV